jgi:dTMP kinase
MPNMTGRFIVLEGIDGAGTTTQCGLLAARLRKDGVHVRTTREPSDGPVGATIRQILAGRVVGASGRAPGWATMALLFAADRADHIDADIEPFLAASGTVISDRYDASSLAYQSISSGRGGEGAVEWIRTLNKHARRPDLTVVLDVLPSIAATRREGRGDAAQLYEQNELQQALAAFYKDLHRHMPNDRVVVVDGSLGIQAVADLVHEAYSSSFR